MKTADRQIARSGLPDRSMTMSVGYYVQTSLSGLIIIVLIVSDMRRQTVN
ncbi:MAG: hypothetical protein PHQ83_07475 [Eubacteriales bacterium]|nr:hypothetical protein [Eubacteriales bacterium]